MNTQTVMALGFFDGVHLGHQRILSATVGLAAKLGAVPAAFTFESHPRGLISGEAPPLLCTFERKVEMLRALGMERVFSLPFTPELADTPPEAFIRMLIKDYGCRGVVCGDNYRFGAMAQGTPDTFRKYSPGLSLAVCPPVKRGGRAVSSTLIRQLIQRHEVRQAAELLGRPFSLFGEVVHGHGRGAGLGYPTINLGREPGTVTPQNGVYATRTLIRGQWLPGVTNVGWCPTFHGKRELSVETHLPGIKRQLYGEKAQVAFLSWLRAERSFSNVTELKTQIAVDIEQALHCTI